MTDTLYYDGRCPLCTREIRLLERLAGNQLRLVDVHQVDLSSSSDYPSRANMLKVLHLKTSSGEWKTGLDANVAGWRHTQIGWLFAPLRWPGIRVLADKLYYWWAERRYCSLDY